VGVPAVADERHGDGTGLRRGVSRHDNGEGEGAGAGGGQQPGATHDASLRYRTEWVMIPWYTPDSEFGGGVMITPGFHVTEEGAMVAVTAENTGTALSSGWAAPAEG
jgi:hypothetical protein